MTLSKKHFEKIAEILNKEYDLLRTAKAQTEDIKSMNVLQGRLLTLKLLGEDLSDYFKTENPKFNEDVFKDAILKE